MKFSTEALEAAIQNAHIEMDAAEVAACRQEMEFLVDWADTFDTLPLEGIKPTVGVNFPDNCLMRPDVVTASLGTQNALAQAPVKLGSCFIVPQILE